MLTLKKYANGRLYDTVNKQYVTKEQLSKLIEEKEKISVILAKTGKDVTKSVFSSLSTSKKAKTNGKNKLILKKEAIKTRVESHKKWIAGQIDKRMDTILEMMNFPNKQQVVRLNADMRKLDKKVDDLQKRHAQAHEKMRLEHTKEMKILEQQYDKRIRSVKTAPAALNA